MRFIVFKRQSFIAAGLLIVAFVVCGITLFRSTNAQTVFLSGNNRKIPIYSVETEEKVVALSFDAAWGADKTEDIMDLLNEYGADGTFFVVGFWAEKYADKLNMLKDNGIEIGTHSNTHPHMPQLTETQMELELTTSINSIKRVTGLETVDIFRCPFGEYSDKLLTVTERMGIHTIQWDVDSLDWKDLSSRELAERVLNRVKPGSIVLMHNDATNIVDGLRLILEGLKVKGYKCVAVSDLIYKENYKIDHTGRQFAL